MHSDSNSLIKWMLPGATVIALLGLSITSWVNSLDSTPVTVTTPTSPVAKPLPQILPASNLQSFPAPRPIYIPPTVADNGSPFPEKSGYIQGYPRLHRNGYSSITIDNSKNNSNVFVKLFTLDSNPAKAVRVFFIRANAKFTVKDLKAGKYDVRYRDLRSGALSRTEPLELTETKTQSQVKYSTITLTLYQVVGGNMQMHPISDQEF